MPVFKYKAAGGKGKKTGIIDAASRSQAARKLRAQGVFPIEISPTQSRGKASATSSRLRLPLAFLSRVPAETVAATIRQMATLLKADLPLDKTLEAIIDEKGKQTEIQRIMTEVREAIREGTDLATALSRHPRIFNTTFVTMVRAGENSGTLDIVMDRLAEHIDQQLALRRKVKATMAYPILMLVVGFCVMAFLLSFVVPKVTEIFFDMERALPLPTRILLSASNLVRQSWLPLSLTGLIVGYGSYRYCQTEAGRIRFHALLFKIPIVGDVVRQLSISRFAKTLGMLIKNGVSLVSALEIVKSVAGNEVMKKVVEEVHHDVQKGKSLSGPLKDSGIFEHATVQMIAAGEQSGQLDELLLIVANDCDNKVEAKLQMLTSLMEPLMILFLGGMVGFVVMAIMLPIFEMSNLVGG